MRLSKNRINPHLKSELFKTLHQLIADLKDTQEIKEVLTTFLSDSEYTTLAKRLAVAYWLSKGRKYENIKQNLKVSSATVASIQGISNENGYKIALKKIMAEEWANVWAARIRKFIK